MKCGVNQRTMRAFTVRALSFSALAALVLKGALAPVVASDYRAPVPMAADGQMNARFLSLGVGKSIVIDLPRDIKDVLVADPKIANAVVRSAQRAYIIGAAVGQTNIVFFDAAGQQIAAYDIAVKRDLNGVRFATETGEATVGELLDQTYTDGFLVIHQGRVDHRPCRGRPRRPRFAKCLTLRSA